MEPWQMHVESAMSELECAMMEVMKKEGVKFNEMSNEEYAKWVQGHPLASAIDQITSMIAKINK